MTLIDRAAELAERGLALSPLSPISHTSLALVDLVRFRTQEAARLGERVTHLCLLSPAGFTLREGPRPPTRSYKDAGDDEGMLREICRHNLLVNMLSRPASLTDETLDIQTFIWSDDECGTINPGDLNRDNQVNIVDLNLVLSHFGQSFGSPEWDPAADSNCDNAVSIVDLNEVLANFGDSY